jgi:hypothetical protein
VTDNVTCCKVDGQQVSTREEDYEGREITKVELLPLGFINTSSKFLFLLDFNFKMSSWTPQPAGLQEILQTIHESTKPSRNAQQSITEVSSTDIGHI